uniref:SKI/DACH domain containing 1 n=1 Tax=Poecilia formosa TaxID=48698 RepID=A0A087XIX8_POEFO
MGDLVCGFEEMQGVRLGYLLIKGKQMFALSQVFTDLLKNIPRTTVHKRMDYLKVKKHQCDLEELRKLKAINSIAFHAAKCTLISREDVEALYVSCKTERVLKSAKKRRATAACPRADDDDDEEEEHAPSGVLCADAELMWKEKVWFSLHGVPENLALHGRTGRRRELSPSSCLTDAKLPQFYHKAHGRDCRWTTKSSRKHVKNYETEKFTGNRFAVSQRHAFFRQPVLFQSAAAAAQSRLSRSAGDSLHKRKRRREGGGRSKHVHLHAPPVLLVQPKSSGASFGAFHLTPDFYLDPRQPGFAENYSSDTESCSTYSDPQCQDSDFGSGFSSTSSSSSEEEEEEDDTQSESSEVSSDEDEESSTQSDSSSVSSRVSVQSIRFRRARVGLHTGKAPLVLQPTFHYNNQQHRTLSHGDSRQDKHQKCYFGEPRKDSLQLNPVANGSIFTEPAKEKAFECDPNRTEEEPVPYSPGLDPNKASLPASFRSRGFSAHAEPSKLQKCVDKREKLKPSTPPKRIKTESEEPHANASPYPDSGRTAFNLSNVKIKVEESCDEYEYLQSQAAVVKCKGDKADLSGAIKHGGFSSSGIKAAEKSPDVAPRFPCGPQECRSSQDAPSVEEGEQRNKTCRAPGREAKKPRISRTHTKQNVPRVNEAPSSSSCSSSSSSSSTTEDLRSRRKRSTASNLAAAAAVAAASPAKTPFSLMANFPSPPSLVVDSNGDLCPAYSLSSLRGAGPPPPSHPVWRWQPGGQILPPPLHTQRTRKY